jgi:hypothetical protein
MRRRWCGSVQKDATRGKRIGAQVIKVVGRSLDRPEELDALGNLVRNPPTISLPEGEAAPCARARPKRRSGALIST